MWFESALFLVQSEATQNKLLLKDKVAETYFHFFLKQKHLTKSKLIFLYENSHSLLEKNIKV